MFVNYLILIFYMHVHTLEKMNQTDCNVQVIDLHYRVTDAQLFA